MLQSKNNIYMPLLRMASNVCRQVCPVHKTVVLTCRSLLFRECTARHRIVYVPREHQFQTDRVRVLSTVLLLFCCRPLQYLQHQANSMNPSLHFFRWIFYCKNDKIGRLSLFLKGLALVLPKTNNMAWVVVECQTESQFGKRGRGGCKQRRIYSR